MLTGILRLVATSYANSTCEKDLTCHFCFICSSLVALMALSFSRTLKKIVCFCSTGFYPLLL